MALRNVNLGVAGDENEGYFATRKFELNGWREARGR